MHPASAGPVTPFPFPTAAFTPRGQGFAPAGVGRSARADGGPPPASPGRVVPPVLWLIGLVLALATGCSTTHGKRLAYHYAPEYGVADARFVRVLEAQQGG